VLANARIEDRCELREDSLNQFHSTCEISPIVRIEYLSHSNIPNSLFKRPQSGSKIHTKSSKMSYCSIAVALFAAATVLQIWIAERMSNNNELDEFRWWEGINPKGGLFFLYKHFQWGDLPMSVALVVSQLCIVISMAILVARC
jgi:hypothetical protein